MKKLAFWHPRHATARWALCAHLGATGSLCPTLWGAPSPTGHGGTVVACQLPQNSKKTPKSKKQPTPRPKWEKSVNTGNQLQKLARNTCGHALARFWPPGPMLQARGLAWWVPPGLMHFFGLGGISQKFPSLGGQHAILPMCLPPKLVAP